MNQIRENWTRRASLVLGIALMFLGILALIACVMRPHPRPLIGGLFLLGVGWLVVLQVIYRNGEKDDELQEADEADRRGAR